MCDYILNSNENCHGKIILLLNNQRLSGDFCDIKIIVKGTALFAHSAVMINYSKYVKTQCLNRSGMQSNSRYSNYSLNSPLTIDISNNDDNKNCLDCVKAILNYIYLNQIEITSSHIPHLTDLSSFLIIDNMMTLFLDNVSKSVNEMCFKSKEDQDHFSKTDNQTSSYRKETDLAMKLPRETSLFPKTMRKNNFSISAKNSQCKLHMCLCCRYQCYKPSILLAHLRSSKPCQSERTCSLCLTQLDSAIDMMTHLIMHDHPKPFFCTSCDLRFQSRTSLGQHVPKHSTETPFICPHCRKGFKWKHGLTSHLAIHSKEMKHLCDECGFSTAHAKTLRAHKLVHTGDLLRCPYPGCKHTSLRKENLKIHVTTHNKETPFVCEICGHKFSQSKNLKRHSRIHDPSINHHHCPRNDCNFKSPRTDKLREHVIRQHTSMPNDNVILKQI